MLSVKFFIFVMHNRKMVFLESSKLKWSIFLHYAFNLFAMNLLCQKSLAQSYLDVKQLSVNIHPLIFKHRDMNYVWHLFWLLLSFFVRFPLPNHNNSTISLSFFFDIFSQIHIRHFCIITLQVTHNDIIVKN